MPLDAPRKTNFADTHLHHGWRKFWNSLPLDAPRMTNFDDTHIHEFWGKCWNSTPFFQGFQGLLGEKVNFSRFSRLPCPFSRFSRFSRSCIHPVRSISVPTSYSVLIEATSYSSIINICSAGKCLVGLVSKWYWPSTSIDPLDDIHVTRFRNDGIVCKQVCQV